MQEVAEHFVVWGSDLDPSALESIKQHVQSKRALLFIIWYDPRLKGDSVLARLASDLASCDVLFRPMPAVNGGENPRIFGGGRRPSEYRSTDDARRTESSTEPGEQLWRRASLL